MASQQRTYQDASGPYQLPNDATEHDRLDAQSACFMALMDNKPIHSPLSSPAKILDIGCGTGSMTVHLANMYPKAQVIGIDIAPVPLNRHNDQPSNITFIQGNIRDLIASRHPTFLPGTFDFIFERLLIMGIKDWPDHISAISSLLKIGGWLECHECSLVLYSESGERLFDSMPFYPPFKADANAIGLNIEIGAELADTFRAVGGFGDVKEVTYPCAPRARAERPDLIALESQVLGLFQLWIRKMGSGRRSEAEIEKLIAQLEETWSWGLDGSERFTNFVVTGQKT